MTRRKVILGGKLIGRDGQNAASWRCEQMKKGKGIKIKHVERKDGELTKREYEKLDELLALRRCEKERFKSKDDGIGNNEMRQMDKNCKSEAIGKNQRVPSSSCPERAKRAQNRH
ncbi:unnamed protein product [Caenorhabditis brenneri]